MNSDTIMSLVYAARALRDEVKSLKGSIQKNTEIQKEILELLKNINKKLEK